MCSRFESVNDKVVLERTFMVDVPAEPVASDVWPGYDGWLIRRHPHAGEGDEAVPGREARAGRFGLLPAWSRDDTLSRHTYNARSETVANKPSFRDAWLKGQHCVVPMQAFYEPDWRSGRAVATRIAARDGRPMGAAGLWSLWRSPAGTEVFSFTLLTINADAHPLMRHLHKPQEEKRMIVVLPTDQQDAWLQAPPEDSLRFLNPYPADLLTTSAEAPAQGALF